MYNSYRGQTCIVVGNGPSLNKVPQEFLDRYPSFGTNRIFLRDDFSPTFYVSVNPLVITQSLGDIMMVNAIRFVRQEFAGKLGAVPLRSCQAPLFCYNPLQWVYEGYTVTFVCMELAFFMGFSTVLLVGVDHRFVFEGAPNEEWILEGEDPNHFDPTYFTDLHWNNPDLGQSEYSYEMAKSAFESVGRKIVNLTEDSALEVFEKGTIKQWM